MPTTTKDFTVDTDWNQFHVDSRSPGTIFVTQNSRASSKIYTSSKTGTKNVNWRNSVARKLDASSAYSVEITDGHTMSHSGSALDVAFPGTLSEYRIVGYQTVHRLDGFSLAQVSDDLLLKDLALARIKRRLSDNIGNYQALAPVVELRELRKLITQITSLATDATKALIEVKRTRGKSAFKAASRIWLGYSFGAAPLVSDIAKASNAVAEYLTRADRVVKLHGTASKVWMSSLDVTNLPGPRGSMLVNKCRAFHTLSYRYTAGLDLKLRSANNYGIPEAFGLQFGQLSSAAWELTPFSWLVDYFSTVGAYLSDTFVLPNGSTRYILFNRRYVVRITNDAYLKAFSNNATDNYSVIDSNCKQGYIDYLWFQRTPLTSLPHASLRMKSVDEVASRGVSKLLNLVSILGSNISTR